MYSKNEVGRRLKKKVIDWNKDTWCRTSCWTLPKEDFCVWVNFRVNAGYINYDLGAAEGTFG
jgi:hypothetical protein